MLAQKNDHLSKHLDKIIEMQMSMKISQESLKKCFFAGTLT